MSACIDHGLAREGGYAKGRKSKGFRNSNLHRQVFFEHNGFLPEVVRHTCDNRRCINPAHLLPGTQKDNLADRTARGRAPKTQPSKRKLSLEQAQEIRKLHKIFGRGGIPILSRMYGISNSNIYNIVSGKTYVQ